MLPIEAMNVLGRSPASARSSSRPSAATARATRTGGARQATVPRGGVRTTLKKSCHDGAVDRFAGLLRLVHPGGAAVAARGMAPGMFMPLGFSAILVGSFRRGALVVAGAVHRVCRSRSPPFRPGGICPQGGEAHRAIPQSPFRRLCRARVHIDEPIVNSFGCNAHRRYGLARSNLIARPAAVECNRRRGKSDSEHGNVRALIKPRNNRGSAPRRPACRRRPRSIASSSSS